MFSMQRFLQLAAVQWAEHGRSYLWFVAIGVGVHLCVWLLLTSGGTRMEQYFLGIQEAIFTGGYLITGALFALRYFSPLSSRDSALTSLMRPASSFEKVLLAFVVVALLYPIAYVIAFQICNVPGALLGEKARDVLLTGPSVDAYESTYLRDSDYGPYQPFADATDMAQNVQLMLGGLFIQALIVAGTVHFRRVAWLKTTVAVFVLLVLLLPLLVTVTGASVDEIFVTGRTRTEALFVKLWLAVIWVGVPLLLWASVYILLRERELQ